MRYILLFNNGVGFGIRVGAVDEDSPYLVTARSWRAGAAELARRVKHRNEGPITNLEIQSHGLPGRIVVDRKHDIDHMNVATFGSMLRPVMARNGLIEILACQVASFDYRMRVEGESQYSSAVNNAYWDAYLKDPVYFDPPQGKVLPIWASRLQGYLDAIKELKASYQQRKGNGLEFCLTLARTSGATVRASALTQLEEIGHNIDGNIDNPAMPISRDYDFFGDWEGQVWDFMPNGEVKYLGCNLPRHNVRFPKQQIGPQLTCNVRGQGGNDADVGQRPQRLNRAPLPV